MSEAWRRLRRRPVGAIGLVGTILFVLVALVGPRLAPYDPLALGQVTLAPPGPGHWFGTDDLGRDVLSGILHGARVSLLVGVLAAAGAVGIGLALGAVAGYWPAAWTRC